MRVRALSERVELVARFGADVLPQFVAGTLRPVVDRVFPMAEIDHAHTHMASNATFGKVILAW
jgi:NADPH:quinone reductase-like Zn-dependent oxidoreductase